MKTLLSTCIATACAMLLLSSCIRHDEKMDQIQKVEQNVRSLEDLITRSSIVQPDSMEMIHAMQSSVDNLMFNRVTFRDGAYILTIKREDAIFLGVSEEIYEDYVEYVAELNENLSL